MKIFKSTKPDTIHIYCPDPITIDKTKEWGVAPLTVLERIKSLFGWKKRNIQHFPNGVFLQLDEDQIVQHGVQPNTNKTAPVGWVKLEDSKNKFRKKYIFARQSENPSITLETLDGMMTYDNHGRNGWICYNQDNLGNLNLGDAWFIPNSQFIKLYKPL